MSSEYPKVMQCYYVKVMLFVEHFATFLWPSLKLLQPWTCSECWISNKSGDEKCIACGNPKQSNSKSVKLTNISDQSSSFANVFGERTFKPFPSSGGTAFFLLHYAFSMNIVESAGNEYCVSLIWIIFLLLYQSMIGSNHQWSCDFFFFFIFRYYNFRHFIWFFCKIRNWRSQFNICYFCSINRKNA